MDHADPVGHAQRVGQLHGEGHKGLRRKPSRGDVPIESLAFDQVHAESVRVADTLDAMHVDDVGVPPGGNRPVVPDQPFEPLVVVGNRLGKDLQRDVAIRAPIHRLPDMTPRRTAQALDQPKVS